MSERERPKILVVDDIPENVRLLEAVLVPEGYDVVTAGDGAQALTAVETEQPDLVLLDIFMPELDGYAVCERLRANERTAGITVVALTAQAMQGDRERFLEAGFDGYISKPVDVPDFIASVKRYCEEAPSG